MSMLLIMTHTPKGLEPVSSCSTRTAGRRGNNTWKRVRSNTRYIPLHRLEVKCQSSTEELSYFQEWEGRKKGLFFTKECGIRHHISVPQTVYVDLYSLRVLDRMLKCKTQLRNGTFTHVLLLTLLQLFGNHFAAAQPRLLPKLCPAFLPHAFI